MEARAWITPLITPAIAYQITKDRIVNVRLLFYALILLPPANEVCEGYVFTGVCLSRGCLSSPWADTPSPQADTTPARHPTAQCMLEYTTPCQVHAGIHPPVQCMLGWNTVNKRAVRTHWNAFLLNLYLILSVESNKKSVISTVF